MASIDKQSPAEILAIDDEMAILEVIQSALENEGYVVHTAAKPSEGIKLYEQHWRNLRVVLVDYQMPEMTGDVVLERLQGINPAVRVLLLTGSYTRGSNAKFDGALWGCLRKPFYLNDLTSRVRDAVLAP